MANTSFHPLVIPLANNTTGALTTGKTDLNLRVDPYGAGDRAYTQIGVTGAGYSFGDAGTPIVAGLYKLFDFDTDTGIFVVVPELDVVHATGNETIAGVKTLSQQAVFSSGLKSDTISEKTAASGVTVDNILFKDDLNTSGIMALTGNQTAAGNKTFSDTVTVNSGEFKIGTVTVYVGAGSPEGVVTAAVGDLYFNTDGADYFKDSGAGDTGWIVK